jgi:hypothetical protein
MDENRVTPSDNTSQPNVGELSADANSRRNFLKAAVVASAAVAAAGGAAGAALLTGKVPSPALRFVGHSVSGDPCHGCITGSNYIQYSTFNVNAGGTNNTPGTFFLFFTDHAPPTGSYDLAVQIKQYPVNNPGGAATTFNLGDASAPFIYHSNTGNQVFVYNNSHAVDCPTSAGDLTGQLPGSAGHGTTLADVLPVSWTQSGSNDLQFEIHIDWRTHTIGSPGDTQKFDFVFTFSAHGGSTLCTETISITGIQTA